MCGPETLGLSDLYPLRFPVHVYAFADRIVYGHVQLILCILWDRLLIWAIRHSHVELEEVH